jgi:prepilin-type N-terminal cleavage/methylation domain-containing protein
MTLNNIKKMKDEKGFTIVELLIVIVVIAILAAIIIVAYQGVTSRANTSKAQTNAVSVQKKAEAYNADTAGGNGVYPATVSAWQTYTTANPSALGAVPTGVTIVVSSATLDPSNGTTNVQYVSCSASAGGAATGYYVAYYDFTQSKKVYITGGANVTPGANNTIAPTCSNASTT